MHAKRQIRLLDAQENAGLRERSLRPSVAEPLRQIRFKDLPLIEAALRTDNIVVSLDERAREAFQLLELSVIIWVNPVRESLLMEPWLEQGAPVVDAWKLGQH